MSSSVALCLLLCVYRRRDVKQAIRALTLHVTVTTGLDRLNINTALTNHEVNGTYMFLLRVRRGLFSAIG